MTAAAAKVLPEVCGKAADELPVPRCPLNPAGEKAKLQLPALVPWLPKHSAALAVNILLPATLSAVGASFQHSPPHPQALTCPPAAEVGRAMERGRIGKGRAPPCQERPVWMVSCGKGPARAVSSAGHPVKGNLEKAGTGSSKEKDLPLVPLWMFSAQHLKASQAGLCTWEG